MADCRRSQFERRASPATSARASGPDPERSVDFLYSGHSLLGLGVGMILI